MIKMTKKNKPNNNELIILNYLFNLRDALWEL